MIERQNILDLIGRYKNRYTSCIITSYTIDFNFFEERLMSVLRLSTVKNINVFIDGKYLENYFENSIGTEFKTHKTYSINSIYEPGVFHPKIMLLTGQKHGLLIIGSGNLTSSGLNTNDEIWGAFHLNSVDSPNTPLFATVWNYLQQFLIQAKGFNSQKINWIKQHSPWLNEISSFKTQEFINVGNSMELKFIGNTKDQNTYKELIKTLPKQSIKRLTIISPYFDDTGRILEQFSAKYKIADFVCITDSEFGLLPIKLNNELYKTIEFYDWRNCIKEFEEKYNRLHAKIFHFEYENGWEYLLIGSANASINALGSDNTPNKNAEAGILLRRKTPTNFLKELGVSYIKSNRIDVRSFTKKKNNIGDNMPALKLQNRILYTEINGDRLTTYLKENTFNDCILVILNSNNHEIDRHVISPELNEFTIIIKNSAQAYRIFLSINNVRISTYGLIHNVAFQSKCNPDPANAEISQIVEALSHNPENGQLIELLKKADTANWDEEEPNISKAISSSKSKNTLINQVTKSYSSLTPEQFNQLNSIQSWELDLLNAPKQQISDFLAIFSRGLIKPVSIFKESNEEALVNQNKIEEKGEGDVAEHVSIINDLGALEAKTINRYLLRIHNFYTHKLDDLHINQTLSSAPKRNLTLRDLSTISIGVDLMVIYYGKQYGIKNLEFILNLDPVIFTDNLLKVISGKSEAEAQRFLSDNKIVINGIAKGKLNKLKIKNYILSKRREILITFIGHVESKYELERIAKKSSEYKSRVYYSISAEYFKDLQNDLKLIDPSLLIPQKEYSVTTTLADYLPMGAYNKKYRTGLKYLLIELLGGFLINANKSAGYKYYNYDVLNEKVITLRKSIYEHATFLCLNIEWNEAEGKTRDILLLDLLHFVYPTTIDHSEIENILNTSFEKARYKHPAFKNSLHHLLNELYPKYVRSHDFFNMDFNSLQIIQTEFLKDFVFSKELGFGLARNGGKDFFEFEKPGIWWNEEYDGNVLRLSYPVAHIKYYKKSESETLSGHSIPLNPF